MARVLLNGDLDEGFTVGTGFNADVARMALQPDGKVIVVGSFTSYNGTNVPSVVRLNTNGTVDQTFSSVLGTQPLATVLVQPDGKIVVAGDNSKGPIRLLPDGAQDPSFPVTTFAFSGNTRCLALDAEGRILIGGSYAQVFADATCVMRFDTNGTRDQTFVSAIRNSAVYDMIVLPDGRILAGGDFSTVGGVPHSAVARLLSNGDRDASFDTSTHPSLGTVFSLAMDQDTNIVVGANVSISSGLARFLGDGEMDLGFTRTGHPRWPPHRLHIDASNRIWHAGGFATFNGNQVMGVARLLSGKSFVTWQKENFTASQLTNAEISGLEADPDGDGANNFTEYTRGTDPFFFEILKSIPSIVRVRVSGRTNSYLATTITADRTANDVRLTVDASTNLVDWTNVLIGFGGAAYAGTFVVTQSTSTIRFVTVRHNLSNENSRFLRVSVSPR